VVLPWRLPLIQAPIGPATTVDLVAAASSSGALGMLAASWTPVAELRDQIRRLQSAVSVPFGVNLVLAFEQANRLQVALEERVPVVSLSWGIDGELIKRAHEAGSFVLVQVGEPGAAVDAVDVGADAVIVQGIEAGGHVQATAPLVELVRQTRARLRVPLIAAGGIAEVRSVRQAFAAGADAVACGTAFLAAAEADVHPAYLEHLFRAEASDTTLTTLFDGGWADAPHRVIRNSTIISWEAAGKPERGARPGEGEPIATRGGTVIRRYDDAQPTTRSVGHIEQMAMYAGTSVAAVRRREPAALIAARLVKNL
jgi:nitronate monooxygenase